MKKKIGYVITILVLTLTIYYWYCKDITKKVYPTGTYYTRIECEDGSFYDTYMVFDSTDKLRQKMSMYWVKYLQSDFDEYPIMMVRIDYPLLSTDAFYKMFQFGKTYVHCYLGDGDFKGYDFDFSPLSQSDVHIEANATCVDFAFSADEGETNIDGVNQKLVKIPNVPVECLDMFSENNPFEEDGINTNYSRHQMEFLAKKLYEKSTEKRNVNVKSRVFGDKTCEVLISIDGEEAALYRINMDTLAGTAVVKQNEYFEHENVNFYDALREE